MNQVDGNLSHNGYLNGYWPDNGYVSKNGYLSNIGYLSKKDQYALKRKPSYPYRRLLERSLGHGYNTEE